VTVDISGVDEQSVLGGWVAGAWEVDPAHSRVAFAIRYLMGKVHGTFRDFAGTIETGDDPSRSVVTATVVLASVHTGNELCDDHLRSADFFSVGETPEMIFTGTGLHRVRGFWILSGDLTIKGATRPVEFEVKYLGVQPTGMREETRIGFSAHGSISRTEFGVSFGTVGHGRIIIGDMVDIALDVEAVLKQLRRCI
jgi:polyisoprenoid-binding protein YceI